jgi:hypothetical protein
MTEVSDVIIYYIGPEMIYGCQQHTYLLDDNLQNSTQDSGKKKFTGRAVTRCKYQPKIQ